jgi:hypothetical protein
VPLEFECWYLDGTTEDVNSSFTREILIPEKNITQLNCAAEVNYFSNTRSILHSNKGRHSGLI